MPTYYPNRPTRPVYRGALTASRPRPAMAPRPRPVPQRDSTSSNLGQLSQTANLGSTGANMAGQSGLGSGLGLAGGALGFGKSLYNIGSGQGTPEDYVSAARSGYNLGSKTGLISDVGNYAGSGLAAAGGAPATSATGAAISEGAYTGASGAAGTGALSGAGQAMGAAAIPLMVLALLNASDESQRAKRMMGAYRTRGRLSEAGLSNRELDPSRLFNYSAPKMLLNPNSSMDAMSYAPDVKVNQDYWSKLTGAHPEMASKLPGDVIQDLQGDYVQHFATQAPEYKKLQKEQERLAGFRNARQDTISGLQRPNPLTFREDGGS